MRLPIPYAFTIAIPIEGDRIVKAYLIDLGHLIFPGEDEFDSYAVAYDERYGYYDDNQYYTFDCANAVEEAQRWLSNQSGYASFGKERNYAIVSETWLDDGITQQDIDDGNVPVDEESYLVENVIFGKAIIDDEVV